MTYEYSGYLKTVMDAPGPEVQEELPCVEFSWEDIARWRVRDVAYEPEWRSIPANARRATDCVRLEGRFNDVCQIDNIAVDDPSFWAPLSSSGIQDERFPIDVLKYPIAEITYRCSSMNALPAWMWTYSGGVYFDGLPPSQEWRTVARRVPHRGVPSSLDAITLRLYSTTRGVESVEVKSIRFRAMTHSEVDACNTEDNRLENLRPPKKYPVLDSFFPFGCYMDAATSKRMASMLGVSLQEYWSLALEDIAKHHHNCIALEKVDRFSADEWREILSLGGAYGVKFFVMHQFSFDSSQTQVSEFINTHVQPYADSPNILAWAICDNPPERAFSDVLNARDAIEKADSMHPMGVVVRTPNAFPLLAQHMPIVGVEYFRSHASWGLADLLQKQLPSCGGQQMWVIAPGFIYATDTPEWHTCPEMRVMLNHAVANGARGWFTFAYHNDPIWIRGSCQRSLTGPFLTFSDLWSELGQRVEHSNAFTPLLLDSHPVPEVASWFRTRAVAHVNAQLPEGVSPARVTQLQGEDYDLFCVVSNDVREVTTVWMDAADEGMRGKKLFDLSDCVRNRHWTPMSSQRHLEMFPGQMHMILAAEASVCNKWRDKIFSLMIASDRRVMELDLALVRSYGISTSSIEDLLVEVSSEGGQRDLETMRHARDEMLGLIYDSPSIFAPRSKLIETCAAVCACDGSLCRLLGRGKVDVARQWGFKVIPLAREFTNLRLELRRGKGDAIMEQCENLALRSHSLLAEIRAL